eukprot:2461909-Rhodomonas_salina.1
MSRQLLTRGRGGSQETYYAASGWMPQKTGPEASITEKVQDTGIPVEKKDYSEQSTLVAPPIIFQTIQVPGARVRRVSACTLSVESRASRSTLAAGCCPRGVARGRCAGCWCVDGRER